MSQKLHQTKLSLGFLLNQMGFKPAKKLDRILTLRMKKLSVFLSVYMIIGTFAETRSAKICKLVVKRL